jgi:hypothetical protein
MSGRADRTSPSRRPKRWLLLVLVILSVLAAFAHVFHDKLEHLYFRYVFNPALDWLFNSPFWPGD